MEASKPQQMRLYNKRNERLYLNDSELRRSLHVARQAPPPQRRCALTLAYTGIRLSEARYLRKDAMQLGERVLSVRSLKKRDQHSVREVPLPLRLAAEFTSLDRGSCELIRQDHRKPVARSLRIDGSSE
jgi:integrase